MINCTENPSHFTGVRDFYGQQADFLSSKQICPCYQIQPMVLYYWYWLCKSGLGENDMVDIIVNTFIEAADVLITFLLDNVIDKFFKRRK